jgi:hypothetical protein
MTGDEDGIPFVNKRYLGNVNTLGPTPPPEMPEYEDGRVAYSRGALYGKTDPHVLNPPPDHAQAAPQPDAQLNEPGPTAQDSAAEVIRKKAEAHLERIEQAQPEIPQGRTQDIAPGRARRNTP